MKLTDAARYEILYDLPKGEFNEREVGAIRTKTIRSGDTLEIEAFPLIRISAEAKRERERRKSSQAQQRLNLNNARKRVCRLIETNFGAGDYAVHFTFDYGAYHAGHENKDEYISRMMKNGMPLTEHEARKEIKNYLRRLKREMARSGTEGKELKYLYVIESGKESAPDDPNPTPTKYHVHAVISAPGLSRETVEGLWQKGYVNADRLNVCHNGLQALSKYITKSNKFSRRWAHSRNLKEPTITVSDRKISKRRAAAMAMDVMQFGREILEKIYPEYQLQEDAAVRFSDFVPGAYIYARMRRRR